MKIPEPRKLPSGNWFIHLRLGGQNIPVTASTKTECIRTATLIKAEHRAGKRAAQVPASELTLRQGIDAYIKKKQNSLSPATVRGYRTIQKCRFQEYMDKPMKSIKDFQAVYDSEKDRLCPKTLKNSFAFIRTVYADQMQRPAPEVSMLPVAKNERNFFDAEQINVFLGAVKGHRCEIGALLALSSLRCSELLDLEWTDIDLQHKRIAVHGAVVPDEHNKLVKKQTNKTEDSRRYVPIFIQQLFDALQAVPEKSGRVVTYRTESGILRAINSVCENAGLPLVGIHGLRHSFASLCVHLHIPEETAMSIGGWSDFTTMRKIYTHISQRDRADHIDALEDFYTPDKNTDKSAL